MSNFKGTIKMSVFTMGQTSAANRTPSMNFIK